MNKFLQSIGNTLGFLFVFLSGKCLIIAGHLMDEENNIKIAKAIKDKLTQ